MLILTAVTASSLGVSPAIASEMRSSVGGAPSAEEDMASGVLSGPLPRWLQVQTGWYVNDDPTLFGPSKWWYDGTAGHGYGSNNFKWTYAVGGRTDSTNWAHWYMGNRVGRQQIMVYVPRSQATATVRYSIFKDNTFLAKASIAQADVNGWTNLGTWNFENADVVITIQDNDAVQNYQSDGRAASRIAVDAVAMRCVSNCTASVNPPGQVDHNTFDYVVNNASTGAGVFSWGSVLEATSYDVQVTVTTERLSDGTEQEDSKTFSQSCCQQLLRPSEGRRITGFSVRVRGVNSAGAGLWSIKLLRPINYAVDPPPAVTGLSFGSGRISWNAAARATAYDVEWRQDGEQNMRKPAPCCSFDITYVTHKDLNYRVRAKNKGGTQFGPWTSWQTHEGEEEAVQPPTSVPAGFAWVPSDSVWSGRLTWNALSDANAYDVDWRNAGGATSRQTVQCTSSCGLGLTRQPQKDLQFRVRAKNNGGSGPWSDWQVEPAAIQLPGEVTGLAYSGGILRWNSASSATSERYDIAYKLAGEPSHRMTRDVACCELALARPTGGSIRLTVSAINSVGRGPWTAWTTVVSADRPADVTGLRYSNGILRWNAADQAAFYAVAYKHGTEAYQIAENVPCCQMSLAQHPGKSLQANVQGRTTERLGEWSGWKTLAEAPTPAQVTGLRYSNGILRWNAAKDALFYRVAYDYGGSLSWSLHKVQCCQIAIAQSPGKPLRAAVQGRTPERHGDWSGNGLRTLVEAPRTDDTRDDDDDATSLTCPSSKKYEIVSTGGFGVGNLRAFKDKRVKALQTFRTVNGKEIKKGRVGGKVWGGRALSQWGCSWIFYDGTVTRSARVEGNAVVYGTVSDSDTKVDGNAHISKTGRVKDGGKVSGDARIYGEVDDGGKVSGDAVIHRGAEVNNATFEGCAILQPHGLVDKNAKVSGGAVVWGKVTGTAVVTSKTPCSRRPNRHADIPRGNWVIAVIPKGTTVDSGVWNGSDEYKRAAREWRLNIQASLYDEFEDCAAFGSGEDKKKTLRANIVDYIGGKLNIR